MITAAQLRAARGLLDWTRGDLAKAASLSPETIKNIEHGTFRPQETTSDAIVKAFAVHGVEFIENEGVRMTKDTVIHYAGKDGFRKFVDAIYHVAQMPYSKVGGDKPIYSSDFKDEIFANNLGDFLQEHVIRMNQIPNFKVKLLMQGDYTTHKKIHLNQDSKYRERRKLPKKHSGETPFYVYGDNLGFLIVEGSYIQVIVVSSAPVARSYRKHFETMWEYAEPIKSN